ncbi:MAG: hypothetical protein EXR27_19240 [Betaproteobacteria bacterium]|nr:hypothetical protein [Betaproteobacteria bacterium]
MPAAKIPWLGELLGVQPRIRLTRSLDERSHAYLGYALFMRGEVGGDPREFSVGIGPAAQAKHGFRAGDRVKGRAERVADERRECVELYKASALELLAHGQGTPPPPLWRDAPPALEDYRERGHRRLDARTYEAKCRCCLWGCRMPVEMITGAIRKVPGRNGVSREEEDWVDEDATAQRGPDD